MKKILRKIDFLTAILLIILIVLLYFFAELKIFGKKYINCFGYTIFQVITGSMEDTIKINDIVIVKIGSDFNENDIITFKSDENFITHRVIKYSEDEIITKGDNNTAEDSPIKKEDVVGKVVYIISNVNVWMNVLKTPEVIIAIVVTFLVIKLLFFNKHVKSKND